MVIPPPSVGTYIRMFITIVWTRGPSSG